MLAKKYRLNLSLEKNSVIFKKDESIFLSSEFFLVYLRKNSEFLKVACLSPKSVFKKAVDRNYYRRLLYSFLENEIRKNNFSLSNKLDLVIVIKRNFVQDNKRMSEDFLKLIKKINEKNV